MTRWIGRKCPAWKWSVAIRTSAVPVPSILGFLSLSGEGGAPTVADAKGTALDAFARGIKRDRDAVLGALVEPWSTGPVEGQINRLKLLKRTMYGRAKFDLLRCRVLAAA